jgi:hypothetical protein
LWNIINARPKAFATLAHPSTSDYGNLLGTAYNTAAEQSISGTAIRSGSAFSTTNNYTDAPPRSYEFYYQRLLAKGYRVAPGMDADNHNTTFGRTHRCRTVVLATQLTRDSILAALKRGRYYASDDWNAQVVFTVNGSYMGGDINTGSHSSIYVAVADPDAADNTGSISIYYGVPGSGALPTLLTTATGNSLNYVHNTVLNDKYYYYAKIGQNDGDTIWTAPVWINRSFSVVPLQLLEFSARPEDGFIDLQWRVAAEQQTDHYIIEKSFDGTQYRSIGQLNSQQPGSGQAVSYALRDDQPLPGTQFYRIRQVLRDGSSNYSKVLAVDYRFRPVRIITISPNPAQNFADIQCTSNEAAAITCKIYNSQGQQVLLLQQDFVPGNNIIRANTSALSAGLYFIVIDKGGQRMAEGRLVKQ